MTKTTITRAARGFGAFVTTSVKKLFIGVLIVAGTAALITAGFVLVIVKIAS